MSELKTFLGFDEAFEVIVVSFSMICITLIFLLKLVPQNLVFTFLICSIDGIFFFILERSNYVKKEVLKMFFVSLFYLLLSLLLFIINFSFDLNALFYISYIVLIMLLSKRSIYLRFPSLSYRSRVVEKSLQLKFTNFMSYAKNTYLKIKKTLFQRRLSEREALKLSRNAVMNYLKNKKGLEVFSKNIRNFSVQTLAKDKDNFLFLFKEKNLELMVMVNRVSRKVFGPLLIPSLEQLSYALSKYLGLDLKVVNIKYVSFGVVKVGLDNNRGVYYECTLNMLHRKLKLNNAFLSYKFFLTNYKQNLVLEDIRRIDNFKFEVIYSNGKEKHSDIVDVSNIKRVLVEKKS